MLFCQLRILALGIMLLGTFNTKFVLHSHLSKLGKFGKKKSRPSSTENFLSDFYNNKWQNLQDSLCWAECGFDPVDVGEAHSQGPREEWLGPGGPSDRSSSSPATHVAAEHSWCAPPHNCFHQVEFLMLTVLKKYGCLIPFSKKKK